jgi:hypothetical protein
MQRKEEGKKVQSWELKKKRGSCGNVGERKKVEGEKG